MCHAENPKPILKITAAERVAPYLLNVTFNTKEERVFDGRVLLNEGEVFAPLNDESVFANYKIDYETLTWLDGAVDIAPEFVYAHSEKEAAHFAAARGRVAFGRGV